MKFQTIAVTIATCAVTFQEGVFAHNSSPFATSLIAEGKKKTPTALFSPMGNYRDQVTIRNPLFTVANFLLGKTKEEVKKAEEKIEKDEEKKEAKKENKKVKSQSLLIEDTSKITPAESLGYTTSDPGWSFGGTVDGANPAKRLGFDTKSVSHMEEDKPVKYYQYKTAPPDSSKKTPPMTIDEAEERMTAESNALKGLLVGFLLIFPSLIVYLCIATQNGFRNGLTALVITGAVALVGLMFHRWGATQALYSIIVHIYGENWIFGLWTAPIVLIAMALLLDTIVRADNSLFSGLLYAMRYGVVTRRPVEGSRKHLNPNSEVGYLSMER